MKISLNDDQYKQISNNDNSRKTLELNKVIGFDIVSNNEIIGFAMFRNQQEGGYHINAIDLFLGKKTI